jgi:hypothetical protein
MPALRQHWQTAAAQVSNRRCPAAGLVEKKLSAWLLEVLKSDFFRILLRHTSTSVMCLLRCAFFWQLAL